MRLLSRGHPYSQPPLFLDATPRFSGLRSAARKGDFRAVTRACLLAVLAIGLAATNVHGYVDSAPTLGGLCYAAQEIAVVQVRKVSRPERVIIYETIATLKGQGTSAVMKHHFRADGTLPGARMILDWAEPGKIAVCLTNGNVVETYIGNVWYESARTQDDWWAVTRERPEMSLAYVGPVGRLRDCVTAILAGKETVITAVRHRGGGPELYDQVAFKSPLGGTQNPVWRLRASLKMPSCYTTLTVPDCPWIIGPGVGGAEEVAEILRSLGHADSLHRREAADELAALGREAQPALGALRKLLNDDDPFVRAHAAAALLRGGLDPKAGCEILAELSQQGPPGVRWEAIGLLGYGSAEAAHVLPILVSFLKDSDDRIRRAAVKSLGQLGPAAAPAAAALAELVNDPGVGIESIRALGDLGPATKPVVPALLRALKQSTAETRRPCALALVRIDPAAAAPAAAVFLEVLKSPNDWERWDAVVYFAHLGPAAANVVPALAELVRGTDPGVRDSAARVLANLRRLAQPALPILIEVLKSPDVTARRQALNVLTNMPEESKAAVPVLLESLRDGTLRDKHTEYAKAVANALKLIDPAAAARAGIK